MHWSALHSCIRLHRLYFPGSSVLVRLPIPSDISFNCLATPVFANARLITYADTEKKQKQKKITYKAIMWKKPEYKKDKKMSVRFYLFNMVDRSMLNFSCKTKRKKLNPLWGLAIDTQHAVFFYNLLWISCLILRRVDIFIHGR